MKTFSFYWKQINWKEIKKSIYNKNNNDVEKALLSNDLNLDNVMSLLSPSAKNYLEYLACKSKFITKKRFGNIVNLYLPLYLSNLCSNDCTYCGFSIKNRIKRKILNTKEIIKECENIKLKGIEHLLIVTGEHKNKVGINYFYKNIKLIRNYFSSILMEVQPLSINEYIKLKNIGLDGVLIYQETYNILNYKQNHLFGPKSNFFWRLETPERIALSKIDKIGLGILMGLSNDWRIDCYILAMHLLYLKEKYWENKYILSFPRLRPCIGGIKPKSYVNEIDLFQVMCVFRLFAPEIEISLSTRESSYFRDNVIPILINSISVESKTYPGGYGNNFNNELEQFSPCDNRNINEICKSLILSGIQPVWKDYDNYINK